MIGVLSVVRWTLRAFLAVAVWVAPIAAAHADEVKPQYGRQEVWGGADTTKDVWLVYSGMTLAPFSEHIYSPGLRLRASGGYGQYHYEATSQSCPFFINLGACKSTARTINVDFTYAEALAGWHDTFGDLTVKGFVGIASISHLLNSPDPGNVTTGTEIGPKAVVELWLNIGSFGWTSLDLAYTTAHDTGSARWRGGWRMLRHLSIGPEARFDQSGIQQSARVGAFARYDWDGGEISVASGFAETLTLDDQDRALYGTVNVLLQF